MVKIREYSRIEDAITTPAKLQIFTASKSFKLPAPYNHVNSTTEAQVLKKTKEVLEEHNIWYKRIDVQGKLIIDKFVDSPMKGMSDIQALHKGMFYAMELKAPGGKLSAEQRLYLLNVLKHGGKSLIVVNPQLLNAYFESGSITTLLEGIPVI